jgi:release factor H-coupled RctB family protein
MVFSILASPLWQGLDEDAVFMLVHSGSRGLGAAVLNAYTSQRGAAGLPAAHEEAATYLGVHGQVRIFHGMNAW